MTILALAVAVASLVAYWLALATICAGLGLLVGSLYRPCRRMCPGVTDAFWVGWGAAIALLQVWHLFFRISEISLTVIAAASLAGFARRRDVLREWRAAAGGGWGLAAAAAGLLALGILAVRPALNSDTGLYYMPTVRWLSSFPIVPGLGNLHERLAYNDSYFLYAAMLEAGPWTLKSQHVAGGLLLWVVGLEVVNALRLVLSGAASASRLFPLLILVPVAALAMGPDLVSLSPDIAMFALGIALTRRLLRLFEEFPVAVSSRGWDCLAAVLLSCVGVTVRPSFLAAAVPAGIVAGLACRWRPADEGFGRPVHWPRMFALTCLLVLAPWVARGIVSSGYFLFPNPLLSLAVPWRVPYPLAASLQNWIISWARLPGEHWCVVLGNWAWLRPWLQALPLEVIVAAIIALAGALALAMTLLRGRGAPRSARRSALATLPWLSLVVVWFFTAPDPRFAAGAFWLLAAVLWAADVASLPGSVALRWRVGSAVIMLFALGALPACQIWPSLQGGGWPPLSQVWYRVARTDSGLAVNVPVGSDMCWNLPLPCTPYFRRNLRLLRHGDLGSGFRLDASVTYADGTGDVPDGFVVAGPVGLTPLGRDWPPDASTNGLAWHGQQGRVLLYTAEARHAVLRLHPADLPVDGGNAVVVATADVRHTIALTKPCVQVPLSLRAGFQVVTLSQTSGPPPCFRRIEVDALAPQ